MYILLTKRGVKMAGYCPSYLFAFLHVHFHNTYSIFSTLELSLLLKSPDEFDLNFLVSDLQVII